MEQVYRNRVDIFNLLRVWALFCVLGTHSRISISEFLPQFHVENSFSVFAFTPAWAAMGMFFLVSGYLLGKGFYKGKYTTDIKGIISFWITRLLRIIPMYFLFIFIIFLFINQEFFFTAKLKFLFSLITFTYSGAPGFYAIGAAWFISTIMQLYFLAPIFYKIIEKIKKYQGILFFILLFGGLFFRIYAKVHNFDWYSQVYVPSWANLDYFFCGMLINSFTQDSSDNKVKKVLRPLSLVLLLGFTAILMIIYKQGHFVLLQYYVPTFVIIVYSIIIYCFDTKDRILSTPLNLKNFMKNPLRIIDFISSVSFGFYLYHSYFFTIMARILANKTIFPQYISNGRSLFYIYTVTFILLLIWCSILYFFIEKPSNKFRYSLINKN